MKKQSEDLSTEVVELLKTTTLIEAQDEVNRRFELAFQSLDHKSQLVLEQYFSGVTVEQLSSNHSISIQETKDWIHYAKRQLLLHLQRGTSVRH